MNRPRLFRGMRIAWSVGFGSLCLLLIVLWVRSYQPSGGPPIQYFNSAGNYTMLWADRGLISFWEVDLRGPEDPSQLPNTPFGFAWKSNSSAFQVQVPIWFLIVLLATIATVPWIRWRFSLRTLLIAVTLVAVGMGLIAYFAKTMK